MQVICSFEIGLGKYDANYDKGVMSVGKNHTPG